MNKLNNKSISKVLIILYFLIAIMSYGKIYNGLLESKQVYCDNLPVHRISCGAGTIRFESGMVSLISSVFWPFYWSTEIWAQQERE